MPQKKHSRIFLEISIWKFLEQCWQSPSVWTLLQILESIENEETLESRTLRKHFGDLKLNSKRILGIWICIHLEQFSKAPTIDESLHTK